VSEDEDFNVAFSSSEDAFGTQYRLVMAEGGPVRNVTWSSANGIVARNLVITTFFGPRSVRVSSGDKVQSIVGWTSDWAMGAFGSAYGYPAMGIFHQERLVLANTPTDPQTVWMSRSASWEDFGTSIPTEDTDAITATLASKQLNEIQCMSSHTDLLIMTSSGEWVVKAGSSSDVFTPLSIVFVPSSYWGAHGIETIDVGTATFYVQRHGKTVRSMGYQLEIDGYASNDVSILSSHLTEGTRIVRWAYQQEPWSVIWMALENGRVLALTLQQEHKVTAWTKHEFNGHVRDICAIPGPDQDEVFMLTDDRVVRMRRREDRNYTPDIYLDEGVSPYASTFESLEFEQGTQEGSLQGRQKQVAGATIRLFRTGALRCGMINENSDRLDTLILRSDPFTGDVHVRLPGGMGRACRIRIENNEPKPLSVLGIYQEVSINAG
jgi:hypothetical protein